METTNIENKLEFNEIKIWLANNCLSALGKGETEKITFLSDSGAICRMLQQVDEMLRISRLKNTMPLNGFYDLRETLIRIRAEGTHLERQELFSLRQSIAGQTDIIRFLCREDETGNPAYPALRSLVNDNITTAARCLPLIDNILDKLGNIRDDASPELTDIRKELARTEASVSRTLYNILRSAQNEGLVEKDVNPTMRDGRLVIPVQPAMKRRLNGIVHDASATGKTVFVEPAEVVEANNRVRELEAREEHEIIRLLSELTRAIRPFIPALLDGYRLMADIDFIQAKAKLAEEMNAVMPRVISPDKSGWGTLDLFQARHPLLERSLKKQNKPIVPLDIILTPEKPILIISGPNAGGKSVCLKTVGLLQYMLQCGMLIPVEEKSRVGLFDRIMIDIGDEQDIENDLSTYSGHLMNMKKMMKEATNRSLLLIDEFGSGTEPTIGGAIAEAVLKQFCKKGVYAIITTHYFNLKHFASTHENVVNGAMLYDRQRLEPLFSLSIGQPGSSFAIEIARKSGLPQEVINDAGDIVGPDYVQSDKYLQDIIRDKRYWADKRQQIHQREKQLDETIALYETKTKELKEQRDEIIDKAKAKAEELLNESNKRIENTIREIKQQQAEKDATRRVREKLDKFHEDVKKKTPQPKKRKEKNNNSFNVGDTVRIEGVTTIGKIESIKGKQAAVVFGDVLIRQPLSKLEHAEQQKRKGEDIPYNNMAWLTRQTIDNHKKDFKPELDIRGYRGDEALNTLMHFLDDAILFGVSQVKILHGTGNGILRQLVRQYCATVPNITSYHDEDIRFGGAGITVITL